MRNAPATSRPLDAIDAEQGIIYSMIYNETLCVELGAQLTAQDFADKDLSSLFNLVLACHRKQITPDYVTLSDMMEFLPSGKRTMGVVMELEVKCLGIENPRSYAQILKDRSKARKMYELGQRLIAMSQEKGDVLDQVAMAQTLAMDLTSADDTSDVMTIGQAVGNVIDKMKRRHAGEVTTGISFGLDDLDGIVQDLRGGNLGIIAGRPGTGKTVLGMGLAETVAIKRGGSSLVFSLEMPSDELAKRSLASVSGVSQNWIDTGLAIDDDHASMLLDRSVASMTDADMRICEKPGLTFNRICSIARFQHRIRPLNIIVVDYLGLISSDPESRFQNRNQELGSYTRGFKQLAKELGIPVVVLCQLNRDIESRPDPTPKMADLRDSGEIEQDADVIIMAHRDMNSERGKRGITEIFVVKVRHAQPGNCLLQFRGEIARFENSKEKFEDRPVARERKSARAMAAA
jgi:replicative DNA helicase